MHVLACLYSPFSYQRTDTGHIALYNTVQGDSDALYTAGKEHTFCISTVSDREIGSPCRRRSAVSSWSGASCSCTMFSITRRGVAASSYAARRYAHSAAVDRLLEKKPDDVVIVFAKRSAMGRAKKGQLANTSVDEMLQAMFKARPSSRRRRITDVIAGNPRADEARPREDRRHLRRQAFRDETMQLVADTLQGHVILLRLCMCRVRPHSQQGSPRRCRSQLSTACALLASWRCEGVL